VREREAARSSDTSSGYASGGSRGAGVAVTEVVRRAPRLMRRVETRILAWCCGVGTINSCWNGLDYLTEKEANGLIYTNKVLCC
jgi:hypothetical protein